MNKIRELFNPSKPIDRRIEKVINYENVGEDQLKAEVTEYVATESIEEHFHRLLDAMDQSMSGDAGMDTAVWVSGFYGSGKSSFTKYLGFALDPSKRIGDRPFIEYLQDQFSRQATKQKLKTVAGKHPLTVIMVDLASNQLAGAGMAEVSSVLYWQVMQWAGYSRDRKIAYLEFMLERDGKREAFEKRFGEVAGGRAWKEVQSNPLVAAKWAAELACEFYPEHWKSPVEFSRIKLDEAKFEQERVEEMLAIIKAKSGTDKVVFIVDEVGQYVSGRDDLILNLDGLAKNIKNIGRGKAWLVATAQQTLAEDSPKAQINSPKLFKLKDRFPVQIDLEASDIRTICHRRLLAKSPSAREALGKLFDEHGEKLIFATKLSQAKVLSAALDRESFIDLYPFMPMHLDLLLMLLGRLAKTSGGIGLRSAIKVVQDVLIDAGMPSGGERPESLADQPVGRLANAVLFYDCLRKDIQRSFPHVVQGVEKALAAFGQGTMAGKLAKAIGVLQVIEDFPLTADNAAALVYPSIDKQPLFEEAREAAKQLLGEPLVPLAEVDGRLRFMSPVVDDINKRRQSLQPSSSELRDVYVAALKDLIPKPTAKIESGKVVSCGVKIAEAVGWFGIQDDGEEIQLLLGFQKESRHQAELINAIESSRTPSFSKSVFAIAPEDPQAEQAALDSWRSGKIYDLERAHAMDKDVVAYLEGQRAKATEKKAELVKRLSDSLLKGSFAFRGQPVGIGTLDGDLQGSIRKELSRSGEEVYSKFRDAPAQADSSAAEGFLKAQNPWAVSDKNDPLGLVDKASGAGTIRTYHQAFRDIHDYLETRGWAEGKKLLDEFAQAPYGWSKDTTRYVIAAMLASGSVKLKIGGAEIGTPTPQAIEALKSQQSFGKIGIMLRNDPPSVSLLLETSDRLLKLTGKKVAPLERDIANAVLAAFPEFRNAYAPLAARLEALSLAGAARAHGLCDRIDELLRGDAADAPYRLGQEGSELYADLLWARDAIKSLGEGAAVLAERARQALEKIGDLPRDGGVLEELAASAAKTLSGLREELGREDWPSRIPETSRLLSAIETAVTEAFHSLARECTAYVEGRWQKIENSDDWRALGPDAREGISAERPSVDLPVSTGVSGLEALYKLRYFLAARYDKLEARIAQEAENIREAVVGGGGNEEESNEEPHTLSVPRGRPLTQSDIDSLILELEAARGILDRGGSVIIE